MLPDPKTTFEAYSTQQKYLIQFVKTSVVIETFLPGFSLEKWCVASSIAVLDSNCSITDICLLTDNFYCFLLIHLRSIGWFIDTPQNGSIQLFQTLNSYQAEFSNLHSYFKMKRRSGIRCLKNILHLPKKNYIDFSRMTITFPPCNTI